MAGTHLSTAVITGESLGTIKKDFQSHMQLGLTILKINGG